MLYVQHLDEPLHEEDAAEHVIDYTALTCLINFRICASSGNPMICNNSVPVLHGRNNFLC